MSKLHTGTQISAAEPLNANRVMHDSSCDASHNGTPTVDRARALYRSMNTYDIAQLLHVTEAEVFNLVFGHRAQTLRSKP